MAARKRTRYLLSVGSEERLARWRAAAERDGRTLAGWLRWVADKAAAKPKGKP